MDIFLAAKVNQIVIHDYGCANGDGTAALQVFFPGARVKGFDISPVAVSQARKRWPTIKFYVGDVLDPKEKADLIYVSHTIEHVEKPVEVINNLRTLCRTLIVVVPPVADGYSGGHEGAPITDRWVKKLEKDVKVSLCSYNTLRIVPYTKQALIEGNIMLIMDGTLKDREDIIK